MRFPLCAWALALAASGHVWAQTSDVHLEIAAERRLHDDPSKKSSHDETTKGGEDCVYDIVVTNDSLKDSPALDVQYVIFVERQRLGDKSSVEHLSKVRGEAPLAALKAQDKGTVSTKSFVLAKANLQGGYYYANGGRINAKDTVKGIWVRVFDGPTMLAEFVNPSSLKDRESWGK